MIKLVSLCFAISISLAGFSVNAEETRLFRIGTGGVGGTYYPVGSLIAKALSDRGSDPGCPLEDTCGVPGLLAIAQVANGSISNVKAIGAGKLEAGMVQSDVAYWAYNGEEAFSQQTAISNLRVIASLYTEHMHIVTRRLSEITTPASLSGKRVSLDEPGSGSLVDARLILQAYGLTDKELNTEYMKPAVAGKKLESGQLDAFFIVAGFPVSSVEALAESVDIDLVPISGPQRQQIVSKNTFFTMETIPPDVYRNIGKTETIGVRSLLVVAQQVEDALVYQITKALWNENSRKILDSGHPIGSSIVMENVMEGVAIPLHRGAAKYYKEMGVIQ